MEISVLDAQYNRQDIIEDYIACVWTEQYTNTGNFELVVPATSAMYSLLAPGKHIGNSKSQEVGTILYRNVKDGRLTVKGPFQLGLFNYRNYRNTQWHDVQSTEYIEATPGRVLLELVSVACASQETGDANAVPPLPNWTLDNISNFAIGSIDLSGTEQNYSLPFGKLLGLVTNVASEHSLGIRLRVSKPSQGSASYTLTFTAWYGIDRSYNVVFSPALGSLNSSEELHSSENYYNVCYAFAPAVPLTAVDNRPCVGVADNAVGLTNWERRVMQIYCDDITEAPGGSWTRLTDMLSTRAANALANNNYVKLADGEVVPQTGHIYGEDYELGDIVGLEGLFGTRQSARITEFIRSQDAAGYKEYPTLSLIT